jgi:hypothetical protein
MLVIERWERNRLETTCFEPVYCHSINGNRFFTGNIWTVFEIIMLTFLFSFKPNSRKSTEILFRNRFIDCCTATNSLTIEITRTNPPIRFCFDISKNNVFDRYRETRYRPRLICFKCPPCLTEMLQNRLCFILTDSFRHD